MVVYKSDMKRRYRDGPPPPPAPPPLHSLPKRAKVQAQRKFAQGPGGCGEQRPPSYQEQDKSSRQQQQRGGGGRQAPLLHPPHTEDFLTFLCFRGTPVLPSRLDFFGVASGSDRSSPAPSSSNQNSCEGVKARRKESPGGKHSAVKIHPNQFKLKSAPRTATPTSSTAPQPIVNSRLNRRQVRGRQVRGRRQLVASRQQETRRFVRTASSLTRGVDKRRRAGLRSGGTLPAGSDEGLSVFRRPRTDNTQTHHSQTITYPVRKSAIPLGDTSDDDEDDNREEEEDYEEEEDEEEEEVRSNSVDKRAGPLQRLSSRTRSSSLKSDPGPRLSVRRASRRTKEEVAEAETWEHKSDSDSYDEAHDPAHLEIEAKRRTRELQKKVISQKVVTGRSLKDKSLKRTIIPPVTRRKILNKNLKAKRAEDTSKRRTESLVVTEGLRKSTRTRRSLLNKEESDVEESVSLKEDVVDKGQKRDVRKKLSRFQSPSPVSERSRRRLKDRIGQDASENTKEKNETKETPTQSSVESKVNSSIVKKKETTATNSPSHKAKSKDKKTGKSEVEPKRKSSPLVQVRGSKQEGRSRSPVGTRRSTADSREEQSKRVEMEADSSPMRQSDRIRTGRKNNEDAVPRTAVKTSLRRSGRTEPDTSVTALEIPAATELPKRMSRRSNLSDVEPIVQDVRKSKVNKNNSDATVKTKETDLKAKKIEEEAMNKHDVGNVTKQEEDSTGTTSRRNTRTLGSTAVALSEQEPLTLRKRSDTSSTKSEDEKRSKRVLRKSVNSDESHLQKLNGEQSVSKVKICSEPSAEVKSLTEIKTSSDNIKHPTESGQKPGVKKKSTDVTSDEEPVLKNTRKKLKLNSDDSMVKETKNKKLTPASVKKEGKKKNNDSKTVDIKSEKGKSTSVDLVLPTLSDSLEDTVDRLDEKELRGFDEKNAKETEKKVDIFIEQMILKTSDDESKTKMRSKYKQTTAATNNKAAAGKTAVDLKTSNAVVANSAKGKSVNSVDSKKSTNEVSRGRAKVSDVIKDVSHSESSVKGRKKTNSVENVVSKNEIDKNIKTDPEGHESKTLVTSAESLKNVEVERDKVDKKTSKRSSMKLEETVEDKQVKEETKCLEITSSRRASASSRMSTDTTVSECKVVLESVDNMPDFIKAKKEVPTKSSDKTNKTVNIKSVETKTRTRGKTRPKKVEPVVETSDSEDEPVKKSSQRREWKKVSPIEKRGRPKRGTRELKALDTSSVPLRTSRARVAKHSSSSFYYETDSSSHYSSSEEEIIVKKTESPSTAKDSINLTVVNETKDIPKVSPVSLNESIKPPDTTTVTKSHIVEEKKSSDIPEDLIDFKSDFDRNDDLLMGPVLKDARHITKEFSTEDVGSIVKDIKPVMPKVVDLASTSTSVSNIVTVTVPEEVKVVTPENKMCCDARSMYDEARDSMELLASVAEDISAKMNASLLASPKVVPSPSVTATATSNSVFVSSVVADMPVASNSSSDKSSNFGDVNSSEFSTEDKESEKMKPKPSSIGETWIRAFKRAKIPKPGQLSPLSHSVKPFVRKPFSSQPFVSKQQSPLKCDTADAKFKPFDRSSLLKTHISPAGSPSKPTNRSYPNISSGISPIPLVKPLASEPVISLPVTKTTLNIPTPRIPSIELPREQKISPLPERTFISKLQSPNVTNESLRPAEVKGLENKIKSLSENERGSDAARRIDVVKERESRGGKHQNLPLAVEHTLRRMSPVAVSRKPVNSVTLKPHIQPQPPTSDSTTNIFDQSKSNRSSPSSGSKSSWLWKSEKYQGDSIVNKPGDLELMAKKKVNMTVEEIEKWLDDSTSTGIEHGKDCGLFEKNQCECGFRTGGSSMQSGVSGEKVGRSIVEPPVQLRDIEPRCAAETISTCKVEDYKEKLISKSPVDSSKLSKKDVKKDPTCKSKRIETTPTKQEKHWKSTRSMTEEEMCEFDFRFERNSNSPRESCSEMSSPTPKDEMSSSNDEGVGSQSEKKSIFHKKNRPVSKSPCAFNAENECSVYAFEPDTDAPVGRPLFRRKSRAGDEPGSKSASIAVQVNLEPPETVLECSTQTDREEEDAGTTVYIPLRRKSVETPQVIQGVTVKLDAQPDGQQHRVTLRAKLVTKPPSDLGRSSPVVPSRSVLGRTSKSGKPEQKVRPLSMSEREPPVESLRGPTSQESSQGSAASQGSTSKSSQSTQFSTTPLKLSATDSKATSPLQSASKASSAKDSSRGTGESPAKLVEAPAFYPSEKEFSDPLEYLLKITPEAQHYGICRIVPPPGFKPECKVSDDMRFTSYNQHIHKMMRRWGPNVKEMTAIKKYLATQSIVLSHPPWVGGMEVDLPRLYQTVQQCGGLKEVIEKKRWSRVADSMKIPKTAQDRLTKLDDIYCKYLLPYDTLSHDERKMLLDEVEREWEEKERRAVEGDEDTDSDQEDTDSMMECITKGRSMSLSQFYRIARNTLWTWFGAGSTNVAAEEAEKEYWKHVEERTCHVCVHAGSIDCGACGYGFPTSKTSSTAKHPWNLKVLANHPQSVLRSLPPLMGVTVPTLHVGMLFSTFCWYRDPHGLPWIEYLHTGASKIWYGIPEGWTQEIRGAVGSVLPGLVGRRRGAVWLPSDTAMIPPHVLLERGVSVCRTVQHPGQFLVVFPKAYTSSLCTGYLVSESVYYAPPTWLDTAHLLFKETRESCEPTMFSLDKLLFFIANDSRSSLDLLNQVCPMVEKVIRREVRERKDIRGVGLMSSEKLPKPTRKTTVDPHHNMECTVCRQALFLSLVNNCKEDTSYCLADALKLLNSDSSQLKYCKLLYLYNEEEMEELVEKIKTRIDMKSQKKTGKGGSSTSTSLSKV